MKAVKYGEDTISEELRAHTEVGDEILSGYTLDALLPAK